MQEMVIKPDESFHLQIAIAKRIGSTVIFVANRCRATEKWKNGKM